MTLYSISDLNFIQDHEFRQMFPNVSFPAILTDSSVEEYGYRVLQETTQHPGITEYTISVEDGVPKKVWQTPEGTKKAFERTLMACVQQSMDRAARVYGYDSILAACSYATSTVTKFKTEGQAFVDYRDAVYVAVFDALDKLDEKMVPEEPGPFLASILPELKLPSAS